MSDKGRHIGPSELLQWAVLQTATKNEDAPGPGPQNVEPIDPKWIDLILGKSDAIRMRECVEFFSNPSNSVDDRITNMDDLELLVESLDNANGIYALAFEISDTLLMRQSDLRPLNLWRPIISTVSDPDPKIRQYAVWILGTAIKNNARSQTDFLDSDALPPVLNALESDSDAEVKAKAAYCIAGLLNHNTRALSSFRSLNGFKILQAALQPQNKTNTTLQTRILFLLNTLLDVSAEDDKKDQIAGKLVSQDVVSEGICESLVDIIKTAQDVNLAERVLQLVTTLATKYPGTIKNSLRDQLVESAPRLREVDGVDGELVDGAIRALQNLSK
ncbi:hypothetical protein SmJEL517_g05194 [Synchytrium microbalum]|uniref:Nucleotide exchange factor Fes1 domain-containing protein n=1 Tax=Synchytrium microbalum TaxID=1806994 RepID=A0A507C1U1_9FUNG|nr:uncharacterized protein SmJEL517_g05194 [Synchytrium microbalum]TPX31495.1 hypothetical protein SmJEL517_g05194 [Synchytrium microbalum]